MSLPTRRAALAGLSATMAASVATPSLAGGPRLFVSGRAQQGGTLICRTRPRAAVILDGTTLGPASANGLFVIGFDRDAPPKAVIAVESHEGSAEHHVDVASGDFDVQRIDGLAQDQVTPQGEALLARIAAEGGRKAMGFSSNIDGDHFSRGFEMPLTGARVSGRFGGQRILNGNPMRPHYGTDLAAPEGTEVRAPSDGVVCFAETGLHYEGGLIFIDHGQGLISAYLHLSRVHVAQGDFVSRGRVIGAVGKEGRATGPHLCWRLKWRARNLDPMLLVGVKAPPSA